MASATHAAPDLDEFRQEYLAIVSSFEQIHTLRQSIHLDILSALADQKGRFRVWAEDVGAHRTGEASLHHQLREAPHIRSYLHELLRNLQELLSEGTFQICDSPN